MPAPSKKLISLSAALGKAATIGLKAPSVGAEDAVYRAASALLDAAHAAGFEGDDAAVLAATILAVPVEVEPAPVEVVP